jgi:hypothetical protein
VNATAVALFGALVKVATGYRVEALTSVGIMMPLTLAHGGPHVGDVDDPGVDLSEGDLGQDGLDVNLLGHRGHGDLRVLEDFCGRCAARDRDLA